ncbi:SDR family NAD(P)-dependent oxidoreductase [Litoreibacter albidus]|uniref:SDR family NAD(P)-dependent oxidoreductase n=1 Tax=Litoreibacter albidus TaxID=670155 RepID=UPI003734E480
MHQSAIVAGFGPGLGQELASRLVEQGLAVGLMARSADKVESAAAAHGANIVPLPVDVTDADAVENAVDTLEKTAGPIEFAVFNASAFIKGSTLDYSPTDFERAWRVSAYGGFVFGQAVARRMVTREKGTIIFSGATASLRGNAQSFGFSSPKFALRSVAQCMARELGPRGIHVAHVILDGVIKRHKHADPGGDAHMDPKDLVEIYMQLHKQPRSTWTQELDVRP